MIQSECFHKNPCTCSSQRRESLAWLKLKHPQKYINFGAHYPCPIIFVSRHEQGPLDTEMCDCYCGGFLWRLLSTQEHEMCLYLNYKVWRTVCGTEVARARKQRAESTCSEPSRGSLQRACKDSLREELGAQVPEKRKPLSSSWGLSAWAGQQWHRAPSAPAAAKHTAQVGWWGHFHAPLIYWAVSLTLPPGWAFLASSLHCCHSVYYLDLFFHTHTYITKQPSRLAVF